MKMLRFVTRTQQQSVALLALFTARDVETERKKKRERERERLIIEQKIVKDNVVKGLQQTSQHGVTSWVLE